MTLEPFSIYLVIGRLRPFGLLALFILLQLVLTYEQYLLGYGPQILQQTEFALPYFRSDER